MTIRVEITLGENESALAAQETAFQLRDIALRLENGFPVRRGFAYALFDKDGKPVGTLVLREQGSK